MPDHRRGPSRRTLLRSTAALGLSGAASAALAGCGSEWGQGFTGGQGPTDRIDFWNPFTGGDGQHMTEMVAAYRRANPGTNVEAATLTWGAPYYTKLSLAALGGGAPEVAICHLSRLPTLVRAGLLRALPAAELAPHGMTERAFEHRPWQKAHVAGRLYGVPLDTHPFVMYYRTDLCKKAGLLGKDGRLEPVEGPDRLVELLRELKKATRQWGGSMSITSDPSTCWRLFWTLYCQLGSTAAERALLADGGQRVTMDDDRAVEALEFMRRLTTTERVMPQGVDPSGAIALFTSGRAGVLFDGVWQLPSVQPTGVAFDMLPFPRVFTGGPYACHADSHSLVLPAQAIRNGSHREDVALGFVRSLLDSSLVWAQGGHIPAWLAVQHSARYRKLLPQAHYADAAAGAVYDPDAWYSGAGSNLENQLGGVLVVLLGGRTSARSAARGLRSHLKSLAATTAPA